MPSICRNCGRLAGLPSCIVHNKYGIFCETCNFSGDIDPPFKITENEYIAKSSLLNAVGASYES